jgi:hypothetical protein
VLKVTIKPGQRIQVGDAIIAISPVPGSSRLSIAVSGPIETTPVRIEDSGKFVPLSKKFTGIENCSLTK